ncbi:MAG: DUF2070 family protein [Thermoplasmata archaeon]
MDNDRTSRTFADLSAFLRRAPKFRYYPVPLIIITLIDILFTKKILETSVIILASFLLGSYADLAVTRKWNFFFPFRRIVYLNFFTLGLSTIFFWALFAFHFMNISGIALLTFSFTLTAFVRSMVYYVYYGDNFRRAILPALVYPSITIITAFSVTLIYSMAISTTIAMIIFAFAGYVYANWTMGDFKREFGQSPVKVMNMFLNLHTMNSSNHEGLDFFYQLYSLEREVPISIIDVKSPEGERKLLMVFPYVHPGPFGSVGSSNLPEKLLIRLSDITPEIMVFHTATTNSNNCRDDLDVDSIAEGVRSAMELEEEISGISRFKKLNVGRIKMGLQRFGDVLLCAIIPENRAFDDIELEEGMKMMSALKESGARDSLIIDAQNFFSHGSSSLNDLSFLIPPSIREFKKMDTTLDFSMGYGRTFTETAGLGKLGVQAVVIRTGEKYNAYVLTDSNNILREIIDESRKLLKEEIDNVEIYTTDNHYVNKNTLDMNPLGQRDNPELIVELIVDAVIQAKSSLQKVKLYHGSSNVKVHMGEKEIFQKLQNVVFSSIRRAKYLLLLDFIPSLIVAILAFTYLMSII